MSDVREADMEGSGSRSGAAEGAGRHAAAAGGVA